MPGGARPRPNEGPAKLAKYELLARLARGGMAEIWVARSRGRTWGEEQVCVVKQLLPEHAKKDDFIQMFLDEGRIASTLHHPNVVETFDFGSEAGHHYLVMEYLHGEDLRTILRNIRADGTGVPMAHAVHIAMDACAGLHHAHEARANDGTSLGIVHRDVSPHNVIVTFEGAVKVVDFGIAKSEGRRYETLHGTLKGKIPYMSPEQVKGHALDRRSDVYAIGVLLYEMLLGKRPYALSAPGDFAMMMAIARHAVRVPTQVDPAFPPELERIVMKAMSFEPGSRYPTAQRMKADLDTFARGARLDTSSGALAQFMADRFGNKVDEWRVAQRAEKDLIAHVVEIEEGRAHDDDVDVPASSDAVMSRSLPHLPTPNFAASPAVASALELLGVMVVTLQGRVDETFEGAALGRGLKGAVLFDLKGVERVTSFGVREWLEMNRELEKGGAEVWLARCSEPVVAQMSLIQGFAGEAKVVSFVVPFLCDDCGTNFRRTLDCQRDAAMLQSASPPSASCPQCGAAAKLDDDPSVLSFAARFAGYAVPPRVRALLSTMDERDRGSTDVVDKIINGNETRVRIHREVDRSFRWNRVLDGIEGALVVDFRGAPRFTDAAAQNFARAIRPLEEELSSCEILEAPAAILVTLAPDVSRGVVHVSSVVFEGRCPSCSAARAGVIPMRSLEAAARESRPPKVPCRRCNAHLEGLETAAVMSALFGAAEGTAFDTATPNWDHEPDVPVTPMLPARDEPAPPAQRVGRARNALRLVIVLVAVALAAALVIVFVARRQRGEAPPAGTSSTPAASPGVEPGIHRSDGAIFSSARAVAATEEAAREEARTLAIGQLVREIGLDLPAEVRDANLRIEAKEPPSAVAKVFVEQVGGFVAFEPVEVDARREGDRSVVSARYRARRDAVAQATAFYGRTRSIGGLRLAQALPIHGARLVVVGEGGAEGLKSGALLSMVDGEPLRTLDALQPLEAGAHDATFVQGGATVHVTLGGRQP